MTSPDGIRLVVGLGNPGKSYDASRHNAGFMVVDELAIRYDIALKQLGHEARYGIGRISGKRTILAKPLAYMNKSGPPVRSLARKYEVLIEDMLIVHDDMDLEFGRLKIKEKGGHGGHRGIKSLMDVFGTGDFVRLRVGIGRPPFDTDAAEYVLGRFSKAETRMLPEVLNRSTEAVATLLCEGVARGMNIFNRKTSIAVKESDGGKDVKWNSY